MIIALNTAKTDPVGIMSLEMDNVQNFGRLVSMETGISHHIIDREVIYSEKTLRDMIKGVDGLSKYKLFFCDKVSLNINEIKAKAHYLKRKYGLKMLIIDYLQLIEGTKSDGNREQQISKISRGLKMLAMELKIPIIALSQLNRASTSGTRPTMSHLRESGAIEQDADVIMILHRDWMADKKTDEQGNSTEDKADLFVEKWRNGTPLDLKLRFTGNTMRFTEWIDEPFAINTPPVYDNPSAGIRPNIDLINTNDLPF